MENIRKIIDDLTDELNEAAKAYYNGMHDVMSDASYDDKANFLHSLEQAYPQYKRADSPNSRVGYRAVSSNLEKVAHKQPQISLDKRYDVEEIVEFFEGKYPVIASFKGDGLTLVLHERDHRIVDCVTRGNGLVGERVLSQSYAIENVPKYVEYEGEFAVRGEAVIPKEMLDIINDSLPEGKKPYKTCRNLASGTMRNMDPQVVKERGVMLQVFDLQNSSLGFEYDSQQRDWMRQQGFELIPYKVLHSADEIRSYIDYVTEIRDTIPYDIDGIVFGCDKLSMREALGSTNKYPRYMIAYKYPNKGRVTTVTDIQWQQGRFSLTPVVTVEPINFDGVTVTKATAHNLNFVQGKDDKGKFVRSPLMIGSMVKIERSGEVIPKIAEVFFNDSNKVGECTYPSVCPCCGAPTMQVGVDLVCTNDRCVGKLKAVLRFMVSREALNITGMGESTIDTLVDEEILMEPSDMFALWKNKKRLLALDGFAEKSVAALLQEIENCTKLDLPAVINALGIKGIGPGISKLIATKLYPKTLVGMLTIDYDWLVAIPGIGDAYANNIIQWLNSSEGELLYCFMYRGIGSVNHCKPVVGGSLEGKTFVVTGTMSVDRKTIEQRIKDAGGKVSSSVSSKTSYVVAGNNPGASKITGASEKKVPVISEEDLYEMM